MPLLASTARCQVPPIAETVSRLRAIQVPEFPATDIPPAVRPLLKQLKHELRDLITATLNERGAEAALASKTQQELLLKMKASGAVGPAETPWYGLVDDVRIDQPQKHRDLLAVVTDLDIPCGQDSSLYLYQNKNSGWELILAQEANDYAEINGAQGDFKYQISPPDEQRGWFLVSVDVSPWCSSNWHAIRYRVLRPGLDPYQPRVLLNQEDGARVDFSPIFRISTTSDSFTLKYPGHLLLDADLLIREHVAAYSVQGDRVGRTTPVAFHPQDFLDEWIEMPWADAERWSDPSRVIVLREWHEALRNNREPFYYSNFEFVQPCNKGEPTRWQIALSIDSSGRKPPLRGELFFSVQRKGPDFMLQEVSGTRPPGCPGSASPVETLPDWKAR